MAIALLINLPARPDNGPAITASSATNNGIELRPGSDPIPVDWWTGSENDKDFTPAAC